MWRALLAAVLVLGDGSLTGSKRSEVQVLGQGARLLAIQGIAIRPDGTVLVSDRLDYRVKKFAPAGGGEAVLRGVVGGRGRGPGQFQGPGPLDCFGRLTAVADFTTGRVQVLQDLLAVRTIEVPGAVSDLCYDGTGNLWVLAVTLDRQRGLFVYGPDGRERKALALMHGEGDLFYDAGFVAWLGKGMMGVGYYLRNTIELWDTAGRFIREFAVDGFPERAPVRHVADAKSTIRVPAGSVFRSMTSDGKGKIYLLAADYSAHPYREVVELDGEGKLSRRIAVGKSCLIRADRRAGLFAVSADRKSLVRYSLGGRR